MSRLRTLWRLLTRGPALTEQQQAEFKAHQEWRDNPLSHSRIVPIPEIALTKEDKGKGGSEFGRRTALRRKGFKTIQFQRALLASRAADIPPLRTVVVDTDLLEDEADCDDEEPETPSGRPRDGWVLRDTDPKARKSYLERGREEE